MARTRDAPDWEKWLRSWDRQQESFDPAREHRFTAMMDVLEEKVGRRFTVLDLGCGPGSFSARILERFPAARVVALDYDPVVRRIGFGALGTAGGRLTWVDAKLGSPGWTRSLPRKRYDAAVSTTALHWLTPPQLSRLYIDLGRQIRRGGVFLNGDFLPWGESNRDLADLGTNIVRRRMRQQHIPARERWGAWRRWWNEARKTPALSEAFLEHDRRDASHPHTETVTLDQHVRRLRAARFRTVEVVWQIFENRVLLAVR